MMRRIFLRTLFFFSTIFGGTLVHADTSWPPETGAKIKGNALEYPTTLVAANSSLSDYLNKNAVISSMQITNKGPVFTLKQGKQNLICFVYPANQKTGKEIATSKCYILN